MDQNYGGKQADPHVNVNEFSQMHNEIKSVVNIDKIFGTKDNHQSLWEFIKVL